MTQYRKQIGIWGEQVAADWLTQRGYAITARNVRTPYGEIDVIARQGDATVFVEVKTQTASQTFFPEHNVTLRKQRHILDSAQYYAAKHEIDHWQIDVIAVQGKPDGAPPIFTHFENAI